MIDWKIVPGKAFSGQKMEHNSENRVMIFECVNGDRIMGTVDVIVDGFSNARHITLYYPHNNWIKVVSNYDNLPRALALVEKKVKEQIEKEKNVRTSKISLGGKIN